MARFIEGAGKATAAYLKPVEEGKPAGPRAMPPKRSRSLGRVAEAWMSDPQRAFEAQARLGSPVPQSLGLHPEARTGRIRRTGGRARTQG